MAWPTGSVNTTNLDAGSDSPALARPDLKTMADKVNAMIPARAAADGVASLDANTLIPVGQLPPIPAMKVLLADIVPAGSQTFTVPTGVTRILVLVAGAGGGGGYITTGTGGDHGGGGGAGGVAIKSYTVVPGSNCSYAIGAKGVGKDNSSDGDGSDGGNTTFTSHASSTPSSHTTTGGGGTKGLGLPDRVGGSGGSGASGDLNLIGGNGASGARRGGNGGSNMMAGGIAITQQGAAGNNGGFGGGGFGSGGAGGGGFDGASGGILILGG